MHNPVTIHQKINALAVLSFKWLNETLNEVNMVNWIVLIDILQF